MANKYYIWKDPGCNGTNPDWIEISGTQFYALGKDKTQKRYFKRIDDGVEDGADVLIMETTYEEYKDWHKRQESKRRKKKRQEQYKPQFISLDDTVYNTEFTYNDVIPDEDISIEESFVMENESYRLEKIIEELNEKEKLVFDILMEAYNSSVSERMVCLKRGMDQGTFIYRKKKLLNKFRVLLSCE